MSNGLKLSRAPRGVLRGLAVALAAVAAAAALGCIAAPAALAQAAAAPRLPAGVERVRTVEGITEYRLANGLQVLLYPDAARPTATVNITYKVGSRHENYGETGMAHLLEHLIFKGSKRFPNPDKEFSARGFRNNGTTSWDRTNYFSTFQASDDNLRWALAWKADAMVNSFIAKKDLDSEMTVVRNEYEMGESEPGQVLYKRLFAIAYDWHNYAKLPIGNRSDIENVDIARLQAFYRNYYQPDNAVLTVAGKFDEARTLGWIARTFGVIPRPRRTLAPEYTVEPTADGERSVVVRRTGGFQLVALAYRIPSALSREAGAIGAAAEVLGDTPNGRLHRELVVPGLAAQVFAFPMWLKHPGLIVFGAVVKPGQPVEPVREKLIELVEGSLAKQAATEEELNRYRQDVETSFERALADPQQLGITLSESIALGDWRLFFLARDDAAKVDARQVGEVAARFFRRDNRVVGMFIPDEQPQRAEIPAPLAPSALLADFRPRAAATAGEVFEPTQANIDARTKRLRIGDLQVALLPKQTRGGTVNVALSFRFGDEKSLANRGVVPSLTAAMLDRGTVKLTRQQIADERTRLKIVGGLTSFQATRATLAEALRLTAHVMREANFPADELDQLKRASITGLTSQLTDPGAMANDALMRHMNRWPAGDPRAYIPLAQRIELTQQVTREDLVKFHADFWGTARGEVAIVGDFDAAAIEPLIRELFAGWASKAPYARVLDTSSPPPPARLIAATPDKENALYRARQVLDLNEADADFPALVLADAIIGGGSGLSSRLIDRLRQKDGLSYSAGSGLGAGRHDRAGSFGIGAIGAPQNMARIEAAVREELERVLRDGFTAKEVEDARRGLLQERLLNRSDDGVLASSWTANLDAGRTFAFSAAFEERLRALTPADLLAAVRRHIDPAKMSIAIGGDPARGVK